MKKYLIYIITVLILIAGIAIVWVVIDTLFAGRGGVGAAFEIPPGRYDCFCVLHSTIATTTQFPKVRDARGPFPAPPAPDYEEVRDLLGAKFQIGVYGTDKNLAKYPVQETFRRLEQIEDLVSLDKEDSEVSRINREAFDRPVKLSDELYFVINRAQEISLHTGGAFDITAGPIRRLWDHYASYDQTPPDVEINKYRVLVGWRNIEIDRQARTIRFKKKGMTIDLHDIVRGFALDQAAYSLRTQGISKGFITIGDPHMDGGYLMKHPEGGGYVRGIPGARGELKYSFDSDRPAMVTKGYYKGYQFIGNTVISGVIDPQTGRTVGLVASCTVVGPDAMTCDALATAIAVKGGGRVNAIVGKLNPGGEDVPEPQPEPE